MDNSIYHLWDTSQPKAAPVQMTTGDGFVVVSWWHDRADYRKGEYHYEHCATIQDATQKFNEYERGEHHRAREIGVFASQGGMPIGGRII
jgi:heme-degrading monooxygenase HmoA